MQLVDDRFSFASNSQQQSLVGTQQCAQMLISEYVIPGSILGMLRVYLVYFSAASTRRVRVLTAKQSSTAHNDNYISATAVNDPRILPVLTVVWQYPPKLLRASAAPAVSAYSSVHRWSSQSTSHSRSILISQCRFWYHPVLRFICQIPSHVMFISWCSFSVSSKTLDRTWLNTKTAHIKLTPPSVLHTTCCVFVSQLDSSAVRP